MKSSLALVVLLALGATASAQQKMERVDGIGGFFFRAKEPKVLAKWFMLNFRVRNLDAMVAQLERAGTKVDVDPKTYPNGRFAQLSDPEGNPIQLWQPKGTTP
jgi:predicted enzyme related to lactoylglutathione lyase